MNENNDIKLLDEVINIYSDGKQSDFCDTVEIKDSTIRGWRKRKAIPSDKMVLIKTLFDLHEAKMRIEKYEKFFELQKEILQLNK